MNYREPIQDTGPIDKLHEVNCNVSSVITSPTYIWHLNLITARKRSLRRLCLYMCPSFCPQGGGVCPPSPRTRGRHPPPRTRGRHRPRTRDMHPPRSSACWEIWATSGQYASFWNAFLLLPANKVWGKVIFLHLFVILFTGEGGLHWGVPAPGGASRPTLKREIEGDQVQAHTQGGNWGGSYPGPHPRGKLRGIRSRPTPGGTRSRPTPKGEIEGDQVQPNIQEGNSGGSGQAPPPFPRRLLLWAVRILLECILVIKIKLQAI